MNRATISIALWLWGLWVFFGSIFIVDPDWNDFLSFRIIQMITDKGGATLFGALLGALFMLTGIILAISHLVREVKMKKRIGDHNENR